MRRNIDLPLKWRRGRGWLVLVGGTSYFWQATEQIDRAAIESMTLDAPIAFVPAANCPPSYGTSFLEVYRRLGAQDGYVVPITSRESAQDEQNAALLRDAGLIYFGGGDTTDLLASMTDTLSLEAIAQAHERGAVVVGMSAGAIGLSERGLSLGAGVLEGWSWLEGVLVSVHHDEGREAQFDAAMREHPDMLGIGLPEDAALALGPGGEIDWWGGHDVVIKRSERVMSEITLRPATPADLEAVTALVTAAHLPPWGIEDHLHNFVVAEQDGCIVGCGGYEAYPAGDCALVRSMAVDESLRGSGLGTKILDWVMERCAAEGLSQLYLFTMGAQDFYLKFGWAATTLDEIPEAARESTQYKFLAEHGKDWPQIVAMQKR